MKKKRQYKPQITDKDLEDLEFYCTRSNNNEWFLDSFEYMFLRHTREFYCINDGFGDPEFMVKIKDLDHLKQVVEALHTLE